MGEPQQDDVLGVTPSDPRGVHLRRGDERTGSSAALPTDFLEQVRGRLRLLVLFVFIAFAFDGVVYLVRRLAGLQSPFPDEVWFQLAGMLAALSSAIFWWIAGDPRIAPSRLISFGLIYEVVISFVIALMTTWGYYLFFHVLPNMNWVPVVVILFPLVLPGPPRRMLIAAICAAAMTPFSLLLLDLTGQVTTNSDAYANAIIQSGFAVLFAFLAARVVYGLGRDVVRAREMGSYQLGELLGKGGMGEVYRATHLMLARPAAIKLIRADSLTGPNREAARLAIARFRREAQAAASLRSPHTVELYDFGVTDDRTFYFVMELLDGLDLETLVRRKGPLPAARVVHILAQVCESLEEAHVRGLVHRDIKPANIHLGRLGLRHDFVKVLDFGLVKSLHDTPRDDSIGTAAGFVPGTPSYMAPELALGEAIDGRADIYAVGCVAYFLLTGRPVFEAANPLQLLAKHVNEPPVPPSERMELPITPGLDRLILDCLAKSPAARPASAESLARSLASVEVAPWGETEAAHWWSQHQPA